VGKIGCHIAVYVDFGFLRHRSVDLLLDKDDKDQESKKEGYQNSDPNKPSLGLVVVLVL